MADDIQQKIAEALDAGHPMSAIAEHLANHENPDYQAYGKSWIESRNAFSTRKSDFQDEKKNLAGSITPMLDLANENPNATLGLLGGAAALYTGYKVKNALEDRRIRRETHESEMEKNKAYVRQVELQAKNVEGTPQSTNKEIAQSVKQAEGVTPQTKPNPLNAYAEQKYGVPLATLEQVSGGPIKSIADVDVVGGTVSKGGNISVNQTGAFTPKTDYTKTAVVPKEFAPPLSQFDTSKLGQPFDVTKLGESRDPLANRGFQYPVVPTAEPTPVAPTEKSTSKGPKKEPAVLTFKSAKDIPEGFVFRPDVGNLDRSLGNILGLEHRANAREMFTGGKPFGQFTGSGPTAFNDEISRLTTDYFQKLQSEIPETILSRDARRAQGIPSDFGTYATKTNFGKAAKVAGVAGTLIAAADIANAAQKGNIGEAALRSADLATDYIPGVAQFKQGLSPFEAGAPTLGEKQLKAFENAKKLGSPYRAIPPR